MQQISQDARPGPSPQTPDLSSSKRLSARETSEILRQALRGGWLHGQRAVILHDVARMKARVHRVRAAFPDSALHAVAVKTNPLLEALKDLVLAGAGLEAAGLEEVHLALAAGCVPERIVLNSPAKTPEELEEAARLGIRINADSFEELERIASLDQRGGRVAAVSVRVNPMVGSGTITSTSAAFGGSKFGVPWRRGFPALLEAFRAWPWLTGLHVHTGSQGCGLALLTEAVARLLEVRDRLQRALGAGRVPDIDIGGGLPVAYRDQDPTPSVEDYVAELRSAAPVLFRDDVRLVTEFGRYIHAGCGFAASRVEYVKGSPVPVVVVHLGADLFVRRVYNPEDWPLEIHVVDPHGSPKSGPTDRYTIAGPLCFPGDVLARQLELPRIDPGDWMIFRDVGAYTLSMWSRHCNRGIPRVLGYDGNAEFRLLRREETPEDVVRFWSST